MQPLSQDEVSALETIFKSKANENDKIRIKDFESILNQLFSGCCRKDKALIEEIIHIASSSSTTTTSIENNEEVNEIRFIALIEMLYLRRQEQAQQQTYLPSSSFPMSISLHRLLDNLRTYYITEKQDYIKAGNVQEQIDRLIKSETIRRQQITIDKQKADMNSLKQAHDEQFIKFKEEWDNYFIIFENKANESLDSMKEQHSQSLEKYSKQLEKEAESKTPLWSRELKQLKKREKILVYQENYVEAQNVKVVVDALEKEEQEKAMTHMRDGSIARKKAAMKQKQEAEVQVLSKRIKSIRETNLNKRDSDLKRVLKRNRNIQESLRSKQVIECNKIVDKIAREIEKEIDTLKARSEINPR